MIKLSVDKLTLLLDVPDMEYEGMVGTYVGYLKDKPFLLNYGLSRASCSGYKVGLKAVVPAPTPSGWSDKSGFHIGAGPTKVGTARIRLDINPLCLSPKGFGHLREVVEKVLLIGWHNVQLARVSRIDAAIDIDGCSPNDWAWDILQRSKRQLHLGAGGIETVYIGEKHGDPMVVYDKARQLKLSASVKRTRIEFRKRAPGSAQKLHSMPCPFTNLLVFNGKLQGIIEPLAMAAHEVGKAYGLRSLLALFPATTHAAIRKDLNASTPKWWRPKEIWQKWPAVLEQQLPSLFVSGEEAEALHAMFWQLPSKSPYAAKLAAAHTGSP